MSNANALGLQKRDAIPLNAPADRSNISIVLHKEGEGNARNKLTNHYPKKNIVSRQDGTSHDPTTIRLVYLPTGH